MSAINPILVGAIATTEIWSRPTEFIEQPTLLNNEAYLLYAVADNNVNEIAFNFETSAGTYTVDWGDGNIDVGIVSGVNAEHIFNWNDISAGTLMLNGMRQSMIKITPDSGDFTVIDLNEKHSTNPTAIGTLVSQILEINIFGESITSALLVANNALQMDYLQNLNWIGTNLLTFPPGLFPLRSLRRIQALDLTNITGTLNSTFINNTSLVDMSGLITTINANGVNAVFANLASLEYMPDMSYPNTATVALLHFDNSSLLRVPVISSPNATLMNGLFQNCFVMTGKFDMDTSLVTNFSDMFEQCESINEITLDLASGTIFGTDMLEGNFSLAKLRLLNMPIGLTSIDLTSTNLDADALEVVFNDLFDRTATTAGTIFISDARGASALSTIQRDIAINKKWTIVE